MDIKSQLTEAGGRVFMGPRVPVDAPNEAPESPGLFRRGVNFAKAAVHHVATGRQKASEKVVAERFGICQECPLYIPKDESSGMCSHKSCGCNVKAVGLDGLNKLSWADQRCPIGKWAALPSE